MSTEMENGTGLISDLFGQMMFLEPTAGVSEHLVRTSPSQENEQGLTVTEAPSFERYFALSGKQGKKIDLNGLSTKMLRECLAATEDMISLPFFLKWTNWGTTANGRFSTASITPYRRTGKGSILSDILETEAESKYFLSEAQMRKIVFQSKSSDTEMATDETHKCLTLEGGVEALDTAAGGGRGHHTAVPVFEGRKNGISGETKVAGTLMARDYKGIGNQDGTAVCIPVLTPDRAEKRQNGRRFKDNGDEAFTLTAQDIHGVMISEATAKGYSVAKVGDSINLTMPNSKTRRGRVGKQEANTLDCGCNQGVVVPVIWYDKYKCYIAIRKLTPRECFRLQGWTDDYFDKAQFVNSDSQLYKQAGNGITVTVMEDIAKALKGSD